MLLHGLGASAVRTGAARGEHRGVIPGKEVYVSTALWTSGSAGSRGVLLFLQDWSAIARSGMLESEPYRACTGAAS